MANLKKYNLSGKEVGTSTVDDADLRKELNTQLLKDYIVAIRNNARQWSAKTKGRSDVKATGAKPHPQKGTGRARQGYIAAAQYRGGGIVFGPRPKFDQHVRVNKRERRAAIQYLISEKIVGDKVKLLDISGLSAPKTKTVSTLIKELGLEGKRVLFAGKTNPESQKEDEGAHFVKSMRNIPKTGFAPIGNLSGYDLMLYDQIILMDSAFDDLLEVLKR